MDLQEILKSVQTRKITIPNAKKLLDIYSIEKIQNMAQIDTQRTKRRGVPEVVFAQSKQYQEIKKITIRMLQNTNSVVISRMKKTDHVKLVKFIKKTRYVKTGINTTTILVYKKKPKLHNTVGIITAGTSDIGVAEEARLMCTAMKCKSISEFDVGVAGPQRIFPVLKKFVENDVKCIIVVAGMEGALATVVASMSSVPVIGVPTSVGYGFGEKGIASLASMLQSCALGLAVVNIDNGVGAGTIASQIANN